jgi:hypothetical protein
MAHLGAAYRERQEKGPGPVMFSLAAGSLAGYYLVRLLVAWFTYMVGQGSLSFGYITLPNWFLLFILVVWMGTWSGWRVWSLRDGGEQAGAFLPELGYTALGGLAGFVLMYILSPLLQLHGYSLFILLFAWAGREIWKLRKTGGGYKSLLAEFSSLAVGGIVGWLLFSWILNSLLWFPYFARWFVWFWPLYSILGALLFAWLGHQVWKRALKLEHLRLALWVGGYALLGFGLAYLLYYYIEIIIYEHLEDSNWNLLAFMVMVLFGRWGASSREARAARAAVPEEQIAAPEESQA